MADFEYNGPYGSRNAPREAIFEHVRVLVRFVPPQPNTCCRISARSRLRQRTTCVPQFRTAPSQFSEQRFSFGGRELALVCLAIFRPVSHGQPENRRKLAARIERASLSGEERRARILNGNGCAGRRMGKVSLLKIGGMVLCATSPKHKVAPIKYLRRAGIQAAEPAPKNRTCAVPLVKPRT